VTSDPIRALVLADGDRPSEAALDAAWPGWRDGVGLVIAADGGARLADDLGLVVDLWGADGDSLGATGVERLRAAGTPVELAATDKDESDTELAMLAAVERGATDITILGALGGRRFDHAIANVALLAHERLAGCDVRLLDPTARVTVVSAPGPDAGEVRRRLPGGIGDLVSLLPLGDRVDGVSTQGLRYPLRDEPLVAGPARGLSNVRTASDAAVTIRRGRLLIVETPATLAP
jgi:thiamine pyrophosphokinase